MCFDNKEQTKLVIPAKINFLFMSKQILGAICCCQNCNKSFTSSPPGFEISDVLKIDDKDYSITFGLYFRCSYFLFLSMGHSIIYALEIWKCLLADCYGLSIVGYWQTVYKIYERSAYNL